MKFRSPQKTLHALTCWAWLGVFVFGAEPPPDSAKLPEPAARMVDFARDIRPILQDHCVKCHGPEKQKGGYRVDLKEAALSGGDDHAPNIHPGKSGESPLIQFVAGLDPEMKMPAKGDPLTPEQIGLLRAWIDQGAVWPEDASVAKSDPLDWWSLKPLRRPEVPRIEAAHSRGPQSDRSDRSDRSNGSEAPTMDTGPVIRNAIDSFIVAKLHEKGLEPSAEADRRTLIRRVSFDLIGLPPAPEEVEAFVADPDPHAYEKLVDRLLASPQYGERWARHWLDVARYGETHGYDKDKQRNNAWPYRDYVIRALNTDKSYGRFVEEQIAGDVLYPLTRDGIEALGFISAGPWDLIGHMEVPETKIDGQIARNLDRDDMVANTMNTFCSTTVQCARCHNHKFDKFITQREYYGLQAVFAALDRTDKRYDLDPAVALQRAELEARRKTLTAQRDEIRAAATGLAGAPAQELEQRIATMKKPQPGQTSKAEAYGYHSAISPAPDTMKWVQVDLGKSVALGKIALHACKDDFNGIGEGFGFPARFKVEISDDPTFAAGVTTIADQTLADFANPRLKTLEYPVNGQPARFVRVTATKLALRKNDYIFALAELGVFDVTENNVALGGAVTALDSIEAPPRWRKTNLVDAYYPGASLAGAPDELEKLTAERDRLIEAAMSVESRNTFTDAGRALAETDKAIGKLPPPRKVYAGTIQNGTGAFTGTGPNGGRPRIIHVLYRGDVQNPRETVDPGALPVIPGVPGRFSLEDAAPEGERRAALARWITNQRNPLTWRSIVNRVWEYHFGRALVDSPNDFGRMGQQPTHPELLDWLAAEFRDGGQSLKQLHRLIVTSATYRQSSIETEASRQAAQSADADNRLLWRMNRRRLEAEAIHDSVLSAAGQLDLTMGGPSYQDFVIEHPEHSPHYEYRLFDPEDPKSHRRSIYRFIVRSQPQPFMTTLDCADPSMSVEKRNESMTALQALALLNDQLMLAMAAHFAQRIAKESGTPEEQIERAYLLALGRKPRTDEHDALTAYAKQHGMANACRVIFNLNEFVFVD
jgi:mono/diheme cytochrome c family protein